MHILTRQEVLNCTTTLNKSPNITGLGPSCAGGGGVVCVCVCVRGEGGGLGHGPTMGPHQSVGVVSLMRSDEYKRQTFCVY